jgi:hypothetical protein
LLARILKGVILLLERTFFSVANYEVWLLCVCVLGDVARVNVKDCAEGCCASEIGAALSLSAQLEVMQ